MNRIVKRHLPVSSLPMDWQAGLPRDAKVRVEINVEDSRPRRLSLASLVGRGRNIHGGEAEILEHIDAIRADR